MLLHRIDDPGTALSREPHKGYLRRATAYAPAGSTYATFAARVLHGELLAYSVMRGVSDPDGLLLLEFDPEGQAVNLAALTLRPRPGLFDELIAEVWALANALGFHRLECRSRRYGMVRHLVRKGWKYYEYLGDSFVRFRYDGPSGAIALLPKPALAPCANSGNIIWTTTGAAPEACSACDTPLDFEQGLVAGEYFVPEHQAPTMADLHEDFPHFGVRR
jgi:hypothetical protein